MDLGLINRDFPVVGAAGGLNVHNFYETDKNKDIESYPPKSFERLCSCPNRTLPPEPPKELPFPAIASNREKLKEWILSRYASSAFNQCEHQSLPLMKGSPPISLHVNPDARPVAIHKSRPVPIHWREQVLAELERDVRIGVLERVPIGEPTTWCSPMVICPKANGDPDAQSICNH